MGYAPQRLPSMLKLHAIRRGLECSVGLVPRVLETEDELPFGCLSGLGVYRALMHEGRFMEIVQFEDIQDEFINRLQQAIYCNVATVDPQVRPRSRVMHVIWD